MYSFIPCKQVSFKHTLQRVGTTMKVKGKRESTFYNPKNRETTRDERVQIIALRDKAKLTWKEIGLAMTVDFRTCQKIYKRAQIQGR